MKNFTLACLLLLAVVACKKEEEATPEAGATVAGNYQLTLFGLDNGAGAGYSEATLPVTTGPVTGSGTITAVRKDASNVEISAKLSITQNGSTNLIIFPAPPAVSMPVTLQKGSSGYDMLNNGAKVGTADGSTISIDITSPASGTTKAQRVVFKGKK